MMTASVSDHQEMGVRVRGEEEGKEGRRRRRRKKEKEEVGEEEEEEEEGGKSVLVACFKSRHILLAHKLELLNDRFLFVSNIKCS